MTTATEITQILARAAAFDQRLAKPGPLVVDAWREAIAPHELELPDLLNAVVVFYSEPRDRVIGAGDVIRAARDIRQRRAQIENTHAALPTGPTPQLTAGGLNTPGHPIDAAYEHNNAGQHPCRTCNAQPGQYCEHPTLDQPMRIPHVARLADAHRHVTGQPPRDTSHQAFRMP